MSRISAMLALTCAFLQVGLLANAATTGEQNPAQQVNAVIEWNRTLLTIVRTPLAQPATIHSTRNFAILHAAIFDAVNNIDPKFSPYVVRLPDVSRSASQIAAADQAAMMSSCPYTLRFKHRWTRSCNRTWRSFPIMRGKPRA
jgi:predicted glutamine amidotransferase